jgi:hypothetical protein
MRLCVPQSYSWYTDTAGSSQHKSTFRHGRSEHAQHPPNDRAWAGISVQPQPYEPKGIEDDDGDLGEISPKAFARSTKTMKSKPDDDFEETSAQVFAETIHTSKAVLTPLMRNGGNISPQAQRRNQDFFATVLLSSAAQSPASKTIRNCRRQIGEQPYPQRRRNTSSRLPLAFSRPRPSSTRSNSASTK